MDYQAVLQEESSKNPGTNFLHWCKLQDGALQKFGLSLRTSPAKIRGYMEKAGYVDVETFEFKLPIGPWPAKKRLRDAGLLQLSAMLEGMEGLSLKAHTGYDDGNWTMEELQVLLAKMRSELKSGGCHLYWPV